MVSTKPALSFPVSRNSNASRIVFSCSVVTLVFLNLSNNLGFQSLTMEHPTSQISFPLKLLSSSVDVSSVKSFMRCQIMVVLRFVMINYLIWIFMFWRSTIDVITLSCDQLILYFTVKMKSTRFSCFSFWAISSILVFMQFMLSVYIIHHFIFFFIQLRNCFITLTKQFFNLFTNFSFLV